MRCPQTNGFAHRLNRTVPDGFFRVKMREIIHETVEALQADLDAWLAHDHTGQPHLGHRSQGRTPLETVMKFVSREG